ncbi:glycosyltransferase family 2 protein [Vibrio scophthalmi]|uniref:Putative glycosyltransferase EpsE n=1 Tax=Vibrio scophthalmi TaxID=45658 RepID=A0A1C7FCK7_9VIBR|nr:glycosyltransferase family 2 protein [Vibrio scophthalmi]ANU37676.1 Putative glycosyltransferase EpsE [Vibrio scophthalmi]
MNSTKISVVTACFNSSATIGKTLDSLLNQTCKNFEHIIIDGDSSDGTLDIIQSYIATAEHKVLLVSEPDNGLYDAMNKGIKLAAGQFVSILSSDDWYELDAIENVLAHTHLDIDIIYGYLRVIKNDKEFMVRRSNLEFIDSLDGQIQHPACFVSKSLYIENGLYDTTYKVCADQDLFLRMLRSGARINAVDRIITNFVIGGTSYTVDSFKEVVRYKLKFGLINRKKAFVSIIKYEISKIAKRIFF